MADNRPQPMQSPPLRELPGGAFSSDDTTAEEGLEEEGGGSAEEMGGEEIGGEEFFEEETGPAEQPVSVGGLLYDTGTPGYEEALDAMEQEEIQRKVQLGIMLTQMQQQAQEEQAQQEAASTKKAETDPVQIKSDMILEGVILGVAGFKDVIDLLFAGFDLNIVGAMFGMTFLIIFIIFLRGLQKSRKKNTISNVLIYIVLFLECIPLVAALPGALAFFYIFKIDKGYETKHKMEKQLGMGKK